MPFRKIDTKIHKDFWFYGLSVKAKYLFIYLWTNDGCNSSGCYQIPLDIIAVETGLDKIDLLGLFEELKEKIILFESFSVVLIKNFIKYQAQNAKFLKSSVDNLKDFPDEVKNIWFDINKSILERYEISFPYDIYTNDIPYPTEEETDKETEKNKKVKNYSFTPKEFIDIYHEKCTKLPKIIKLTEDRKRKIKARLITWPEENFWKDFFIKVSHSRFLNGDNKSNWRANLDFFINSDTNVAKVLEGKYDNISFKESDDIAEKIFGE